MPQRTAALAFRYGASFGAVVTILGGGDVLIQSLALSRFLLLIFTSIAATLLIGLLVEVGDIAARQHGRLAAGVWAGVIAAAIPMLVLVIIVAFRAFPAGFSKYHFGDSVQATGYIIGGLGALAILELMGCAAGAGLGVLGALLGRSRYRVSHPTYQVFPPYPTYAGYPPAEPYAASDALTSPYGQTPVQLSPPPDYPRRARLHQRRGWGKSVYGHGETSQHPGGIAQFERQGCMAGVIFMGTLLGVTGLAFITSQWALSPHASAQGQLAYGAATYVIAIIAALLRSLASKRFAGLLRVVVVSVVTPLIIFALLPGSLFIPLGLDHLAGWPIAAHVAFFVGPLIYLASYKVVLLPIVRRPAARV